MTTLQPPPRPSFTEALRFWSRLGWISFGGTAAHIAIMHGYLVEKRHWISESRFLHALSLCMLLPGPEAQQLGIYIGWKLHGKRGGLAAGILFVLPSMFILLALSLLYVCFGNLPLVAAMFNGLKPAVIALVLIALIKIASRAMRGPLHYLVAAGAFLGLFFDVSLPLLMLAAVALGILIGALRPSLLRPQQTTHSSEDEHAYLINRHTADAQPRSLLSLTATALTLWLVPIALLFCFAPDRPFWRTLTLFFTKTAFVTLGGSYTVIPYVANIAVTRLHWLTQLQMTDGFALAETTPGPLIIVVAFVGFMAAFNHFHGSLWMGTLGLLATTFYTFLPCFLFVFAGAPLVERTQGKPAIEGVLSLITAVVVGAILDLTLFLGKGVVFPTGSLTLHGIDILSVVWIALSLVLLKRFRLSMMWLVLLSTAFGAARTLMQC